MTPPGVMKWGESFQPVTPVHGYPRRLLEFQNSERKILQGGKYSILTSARGLLLTILMGFYQFKKFFRYANA